ncbi:MULTISPECIES: oligosaccharide flippase family protein [unclassified Colwellia]|uniref:oligosaccharide flippase family protein n=1 Tax=unclassified Colwellia TaxID=196834 RepID=UPI0015F3EE89|nr:MULTISPECIES: oligosaccharide flippase family protein [unclassified Colwellia]MBA6377938.1 oligosaccharide flippase family protein [Colwellia sp. BRX10-7]MBA6387596.1 oligosaccharide flippase family protein [Colwellia sp. BRX10-2]MBA6400946.1 oligosaccharide flippase family protein [Colwellia sp. BRX10-5]MBA6404790.1 oligosaccharide flippase family protein [Colwellia sp. BRX10-1]
MASLTTQVLSSSFLLLIIRLIQRSIGLISTLILARVLTPNDFGIVAISVLVVHFCDALSATGSQQYIVQKAEVDSDDVNSAWTIDIIMKSVLWIILVLAVPLITSFYERPEIENALYVSSLVLLIGAFKSPGLMLLRRALSYKPIFRISILQKLLSFSIVMIFVYFEPSYWALIIGDLVSSLTLTIGSYYIHSAKPKFCLSKIKEQWSFSQWVLLKGGVGFARAESDTILVSKYFSSEALGAYHLARHLSIMPSSEIIGPAIEPLIASFARVKNEPEKLVYQFTLSLLVIVLLIMPACAFIWTFPEPIINFFLGDQWSVAYPILSALSIFLFTTVISQLLNQFCIALGKVKSLFMYDVLSLLIIVGVLLTLMTDSLYHFSLLRGGVAFVLVSLFFVYLKSIANLSILYISKLILPIAVLSLISATLTLEVGIESWGGGMFSLFYYMIVFGLIHIILIVLSYIIYYKNIKEGIHIYNLANSVYSKFR